DVIETNYPADRAIKTENGFAVRVVEENYNPDMGTVSIEGDKYIYQEKPFPQWVNYSTKGGFEILTGVTFDRFTWKSAFKNEKDFLELTGWDKTTKSFQKKIV